MDSASSKASIDFSLPAHVRACRTGAWYVFLDLRADRYWALPATTPAVEIEKRLGVTEQCGIADAPVMRRANPTLAYVLGAAPDAIVVLEAAMWTAMIVKNGRLDDAFAWLQLNKEGANPGLIEVRVAHDRFERLRAWIPARYVCLFNSLALMRYLTWRRVRAELVFGVRAMPFAAHCWVEAAREILDPGEEDCSSFAEIARV